MAGTIAGKNAFRGPVPYGNGVDYPVGYRLSPPDPPDVSPRAKGRSMPATPSPEAPSAAASPHAPNADSSRKVPAWLSLLVRIAATIALMALVLRGVEWTKMLGLLETIDWRWWAAGLCLSIAVQVIAAVRWSALARPIGFSFPISLFVWRFFEGMFFSLCLPTSIGGDVVKAYRLADSTHGRLLAGCTVLADRLTGLAALGILGGVAILKSKFSLGLPTTLAIAGCLALAVVGLLWLGIGSLNRLLSLFPEPHAARRFIARLLPYQLQPGLMPQAVGWSLLVQAGGAVAVGLMARALGVALPMAVWFAVVPMVALAMVLPISISGVGVREGGLALLLAPLGVPAEQAVAIGLLWFLCTIFLGLIGGVLFLLDRRPSFATPTSAGDPA
ncbi:MAG: UPF0104 family protein [Planctomycetia bacterium]|nr:UPF0104 family protein [Planctomycetia bacterium]